MLPRAFSTLTATAQRALGLRRETLEVGPWRVRVWRGGRPGAEPWLLLHGLGATSATFLPLERRLLPDCEVVLPELSELGGSRGPRAAPAVGEAAEIAIAIARRCFGDRAPTVAGISLGGWIAVRAALVDPRFAARLLLVVPGGWREQDWERIGKMVRVESVEETRAIWRALFVAPPLWMRPARYALWLAYRSPAVAATLATVRESDAFDAADLARLDLPVGLVWGDEDRLFQVEVGEAMVRALPQATLARVPGAAHAVQWERPREFVEAVEAFRSAFPLPAAVRGAHDAPGDPLATRSAEGGGRWPRPTT